MAESTGILLLNAEDNSESGLTITEEGSNNFSLTTGAALHGTYGYNFAFSGNSGENLCYFYKSFTAGVDIYARCYFYIPSSFSMNDSYFTVLRLTDSSGNYLAYLRFINAAGNITAQRVYYRTNSSTLNFAPNVSISRDTLYYVELRYKSDASVGAVECYLNGAKIGEATGLATNNYQAARISIGNYEAGVPTSGSAFYVDDIKIDSSPIGAYAEASAGNLYYYQQQQM